MKSRRPAALFAEVRDRLARLGRGRALLYKTTAYTGLRVVRAPQLLGPAGRVRVE